MTYDSRLIQETLHRAQDALHRGDLSRANRLLQHLHAAGHANAASHQILAVIATELGLFGPAERHIEAARSLTPPRGPKPRYMLIRAWGAGFWADVLHTVHGLAIAEEAGRIPAIHWGLECRYRRPGTDDAWRLYFEPVSTVTARDLGLGNRSYFPPKWNAANLKAQRVNKDSGDGGAMSGLFLLNRDEDVTVFDFFTEIEDFAPWLRPGNPLTAAHPEPGLGLLYRKYLRLKPDLVAEVDRLEREMLRGRPTIAVHYRTQGGPKIQESSDKQALVPDAFTATIDRFLADRGEGGVYLMTDFAPAVDFFRERYGDRLACRDVIRVARPEEQSVEIHLQHDGVALAHEVLLDTYLATRCTAFVGDGASGVSQAITRLKAWASGAVTLFRPGYMAAPGQVRRHSDPSPWWNPAS